MRARRLLLPAVVAVAAIAAIGVCFRNDALDLLLSYRLRRLLSAAGHPAFLNVRLPHEWIARRSRGADSSGEALARASAVVTLATHSNSDGARRAAAVAFVVGGQPALALEELNKIPPERRNAITWAEISGAHLSAGMTGRDHDHLLAALETNDRALALDATLPEAVYDRAILCETLELTPCAAAAWRRYLELEPHSSWASAARSKLASLPRNEAEAWTAATAHLDNLSDGDLARLADSFPQQARMQAEGPYLAAWARAFQDGKQPIAAKHLHRLGIIARRLHERTGESLLFESVEVIERALDRHDGAVLSALAKGLVTYQDAMNEYRSNDVVNGQRDLERAQQLLARAGLPLQSMAAFYAACAVFIQNHADEARQRLSALLSAEMPRRHDALVAYVHHELSLCEAFQGRWSKSIAEAEAARKIFKQLHEHGTAAGVEAILCEDYDFIGQDELAWRSGIEALGDACAAGDFFRARVVISALSRTELRHRRSQWAYSLTAIEDDVVRSVQDPRAHSDVVRSVRNPLLESDMFLRFAAAEYQRGNRAEARRFLPRAIGEIQTMPDVTQREKYLADAHAVEALIVRNQQPGEAVTLLTSAIDFQRREKRVLLLPELLLERGRAYAALGRPDDAMRDFSDGIENLELERSHVVQAEFRLGIFDDAADLFEEAVSAALQRHVPEKAFDFVERGRARAVLEQMETGQIPKVSLQSVIETIPVDSALIEYAMLRDRLAIFVIDRRGLTVAIAPVARDSIEREVRDVLHAMVSAAPVWDIEEMTAKLYDQLVGPVRERVGGASRLIFVPDGVLQQLPFSALLDRRFLGTFLIEQKAITIAPSASVFASVMRRNASMPHRRPETVAVFANPSLSSEVYPGLARLDGAEREARKIAAKYPRAVLRVREQATVSSFAAAAADANVIDFAGHALLDTAEPWRSAILFSSAGGDRSALTSREIAQLRLRNATVVVVEACSTLRGRVGKVDGIPSIGRMFLVAGVPSVIGTLWDIDDDAASSFADILHERLAAGVSPDESLRDAQLLALRSRDRKRSHPSYWASFALMGAINERPLP